MRGGRTMSNTLFSWRTRLKNEARATKRGRKSPDKSRAAAILRGRWKSPKIWRIRISLTSKSAIIWQRRATKRRRGEIIEKNRFSERGKWRLCKISRFAKRKKKISPVRLIRSNGRAAPPRKSSLKKRKFRRESASVITLSRRRKTAERLRFSTAPKRPPSVWRQCSAILFWATSPSDCCAPASVELADRALDLVGDNVQIAATLVGYGREFWRRGETTEAVETLEEACSIFKIAA